MKNLKQIKGITLVALIITIIIMLILAGITISLTIGQGGIINLAQQAGKNHVNAELQENKDLEDLYSSMMVATNDDSKITISMDDLNNLINQKIEGVKPTGIKTDTYIQNTRNVLTTYSEVTSMSGLTRTTDAENKISEYLSYSDTDGYTVLKSGWYLVNMYTVIGAKSAADLVLLLYLNHSVVAELSSWSSAGVEDRNHSSCSIYLSEGDKIHFGVSAAGSTATVRYTTATCYPMF